MPRDVAVLDAVQRLHLGAEGCVRLHRPVYHQGTQRGQEPGVPLPVRYKAELHARLASVERRLQTQPVWPHSALADRPPAQRPVLDDLQRVPLRLVRAQDRPDMQRPAHIYVIQPQPTERHTPTKCLASPLQLNGRIVLEAHGDLAVVHLGVPAGSRPGCRLEAGAPRSLPRHRRIPSRGDLHLDQPLGFPDAPAVLHGVGQLVAQRLPRSVTHVERGRQPRRVREQHRHDLPPRDRQAVEQRRRTVRRLRDAPSQRLQRQPPRLSGCQDGALRQLIQLVEVLLEQPLRGMGREEQRALP